MATKYAILLCVTAYFSRDPLQTCMSADVIAVMLKIWRLEITHPQLHHMHPLCQPRISAAGALITCLKVFSKSATPIDAPSLSDALTTIDLDPEKVARVALAHLRQWPFRAKLKRRSYDPSSNATRSHQQHGFIDDMAMNVDVLLRLDSYDMFRRALLLQGSVAAVTKAAVVATNSSHVPRPTLFGNCFHLAFQYLQKVLEVGNGRTRVTQALTAQIIPAILHCNSFPDECMSILTCILPRYLIYETVLVAAGRAVEKVRASGIEGQLLISEPLKSAWLKYKERVNRHLWIAGRYNVGGSFNVSYRCSYIRVSKVYLTDII